MRDRAPKPITPKHLSIRGGNVAQAARQRAARCRLKTRIEASRPGKPSRRRAAHGSSTSPACQPASAAASKPEGEASAPPSFLLSRPGRPALHSPSAPGRPASSKPRERRERHERRDLQTLVKPCAVSKRPASRLGKPKSSFRKCAMRPALRGAISSPVANATAPRGFMAGPSSRPSPPFASCLSDHDERSFHHGRTPCLTTW